MKLHYVVRAILTAATLPSCIEAGHIYRAAVLPRGPVRTVTTESGVILPRTSLVVRTNDRVITHRAFRATVYEGTVAEEVVDQNGTELIPKNSPVELVVHSMWYLGPGGVGMTELRLDLSAVTVKGVRYPVETEAELPLAGGLGLDTDAAKWVGGAEGLGPVLTRGRRIKVPAKTLLAFQIVDPIRLQGYRR